MPFKPDMDAVWSELAKLERQALGHEFDWTEEMDQVILRARDAKPPVSWERLTKLINEHFGVHLGYRRVRDRHAALKDK